MKFFPTIKIFLLATIFVSVLSLFQLSYNLQPLIFLWIVFNSFYLFFLYFSKKKHSLNHFFLYTLSLNIFFYINIFFFFYNNLLHISLVALFLGKDIIFYCIKSYTFDETRDFYNYENLINKYIFLLLFFFIPQSLQIQTFSLLFLFNLLYFLFKMRKKLKETHDLKSFITNKPVFTLISIIPNCISLFRIFFTCVFFVTYVYYSETYSFYFFIFYGILCLSDFFDGYFARKFSVTSSTGQIFDAIGDKLLIHLTTLLLVSKNYIFIYIFIFTLKDLFVHLSRFFYGMKSSRDTSILRIQKNVLVKIPWVILYIVFLTYLYPLKTFVFIPVHPYLIFLAKLFTAITIFLSLYLGFKESKRLILSQKLFE